MKILICSDSHGQTNELLQLKKDHPDMDMYIHCGDSELSKDSIELEGFQVVRGNCDYGDDFPEQLLLKVENERIFVTHGHLYNVKSSLMSLQYKAREQEATIVCFGHSHVLGFELIDDILFMNPGSLRLPRMRKEKTYIILELKDDKKIVTIYEYGKKKLITEEF